MAEHIFPFERNRMKKHYFIKIISVFLAFTFVFSAAFTAAAKDTSANETAVFKYLTQTMGLNNAAACGVLANMEIESMFNPHAAGDGGSSYGICQWHGVRYTSLKKYCASHKLDYTTLKGQLSYLNYELENDYPKVLGVLRSVANTAQGAYDAGYDWCYHFEVPAGYASGVSVSRGNRAMNIYWPVYECPPEPTQEEKAAAAMQDPAAMQKIIARMVKMLRAVIALLSA